MRMILWLSVLAMAVVCGRSAFAAQRAHPNVVVILADDQGWGDVSLHGNTNLRTPAIDSLGRDGTLFDRFFVCPVCSPTRAEFLTGRYHLRGGVRGVSTGGERLDLDERTIADVFKAAGYTTACFGKWHNGSQYPYHPNGRGFDEYFGFTSGHWGMYFDPPLDHNGRLVQGKGYITDILTEKAMEFIEEHRRRPFFCYLAYNVPHSPFEVPDRFYRRFANAEITMRNRDPEKEELDKTRAALAMVECMDWNIGRLLETLDRLNLEQDTIVVYFSDNGPNSWRWNGGMKGRKGSTDEGGVRVPFMIRWPGKIPGGKKVTQIAGAIDLLPTLAELCGVEVPNDRPLDGRSLVPLLLEDDPKWEDRMIFSHWGGRVSVRTQRFRLDNEGRLFDMLNDPGQTKDVAEAFPEIARRLRNAQAAWKEELLPRGDDDRPFPVGYREHPFTYLPARDGRPHGGVLRSASAPNCSFFTHWTSPDDAMTWDVEVHTAGRYEAVVYYTCPEDSVGSTIELRLGDAAWTGKITEAFDPPLRGAEYDRVPRNRPAPPKAGAVVAGESYVKDFKPLPLGVVELPAGRGTLTLHALDVAGKFVADVRMVTLRLLEE
ncbi:MAG: N-acetylgalactosamine 6-sulfate sulfatase [Planctomycetota bacterium]|nr:MAG: N-acetylgalactosamine 6-sulfate sulfatase [Planctomycetota bacterium]